MACRLNSGLAEQLEREAVELTWAAVWGLLDELGDDMALESVLEILSNIEPKNEGPELRLRLAADFLNAIELF